jgi:hypothetical protein
MNHYIKYLLGALLIASVPLASLAKTTNASDPSQQALQRQLDEERLAYQLYTALGEVHPELRQFQNIPRAESRHFGALHTYATNQYPDIEFGTLEGEFLFPETKTLYDQLLEAGKASPQAALAAGVQVEELDIRDLDAALALTEDPTLKNIYTRLRAGSVKHLAAFSGKRGGGQKNCKLP